MAEVKLSFGIFGLGTPTLRRWTRIIGVLEPQGSDTVLTALSLALAEDSDATQAGLALLPILTQLPELGYEFLEACLRDLDGKPVGVGVAEFATEEDLLLVVESLAVDGTFKRILDLLKNRIPLALKNLQQGGSGDQGKSKE